MRIGIDAVEVARFKALALRRGERFLARLFTVEELRYARTARGDRMYERLAARFAVKEALCKAIGGRLPFRSIEIAHLEAGGPLSVACSRVRETITASLTHTRRLAVAVVLLGVDDTAGCSATGEAE